MSETKIGKLHKLDEIKYSSNQLWIRFCIMVIVNLVFIIVWLFTSYRDEMFVSHFSFASTVTSIILSVLAIFMSVTGEAKTQAIRDRIEREADEIITVTANLESQMKDLSGKIEIVVHNTEKIQAVVNEHQELPKVISGQA